MNLPKDICERIWGFSIPRDHQLLIISSEGIHTIDLRSPTIVGHDYDYPEGRGLYETKKQMLEYHGKQFQILGGELGGDDHPLLTSQYGEQLVFNHADGFFQVHQSNGEVVFEYPFSDFSGDWGHVTFSEDANFIVLGLAYDIYTFERTEEARSEPRQSRIAATISSEWIDDKE